MFPLNIFEVRFNSKFSDVGRGVAGFLCKECSKHQCDDVVSVTGIMPASPPCLEMGSASFVCKAGAEWRALLCFS